MKNSFYFDHDYNSRNDQKILEVRAEFGWEGYAIFFAILECMCESKGYIKREALSGLSLGLSLPKTRLSEMIDFFINIDLFSECDNGIFSERILSHLAYREKLSASGSKGGRGNKKPPFSHPLATLEAGKEREEEDSKEEKENNTFSFEKSLLSLGIEKQIVSDWMKVRKQKKASNTETAFKAIVREIQKSGKIANECITICAERSWVGFEADWLKNINSKPTNSSNFKHKDDVNSDWGVK